MNHVGGSSAGRAEACGASGRGFEPRPSPQILTEQMLRDAHREGYNKAKSQSKSYTGGYHRSFFDFSNVRKQYGFGPR